MGCLVLERKRSHGLAVPSYLTLRRSVFTFLIWVLVHLQEIVDFNTEGREKVPNDQT